ncbi:MAG: prepilin-type N-terminal cleavage/methylation domain-containing protein [Candidatus Heimdallarchaeaceae archaeon]
MLLQKIRNKVGGFTLIELMIVICIIAIAAAFLIPMISLMMDADTDSEEIEYDDPESDPNEADPAEEKKAESGGDKL